MKILWFSWKDITNPAAGGAETVVDFLCTAMAKDGHEVILLTAGYPGSTTHDKRNGYRIVRVGGRWSVYLHAARYYQQNLKGWADRVIEEINTVPFMTQWYVQEPRTLFFHQLCRQIWFYQMFFPLNLIGYLLEPLYLFLLRRNPAIVVSDSTSLDLQRYGFAARNISVIPLYTTLPAIKDLAKIKKYPRPTLLSLGAVRAMKRTIHQLQAFEVAKRELPNLEFIIAGSLEGDYGEQLKELVEKSPFKSSIQLLGRVSAEKKTELMRRSHLITVTSVKEGWGLIVTEAATQGTPAVVYNVDGLRDSVFPQQPPTLVPADPTALGEAVAKILNDKKKYEQVREGAWERSCPMTANKTYAAFKEILL